MSRKTPHVMPINQRLNRIINEWQKNYNSHNKKYRKTK